MNLDKIQRLQKLAEQARRQKDRATGVKDQIGQRLQKEFSCASVEEARSLRDTLTSQIEKQKKQLEKKYKKLQEDWPDELESLENGGE